MMSRTNMPSQMTGGRSRAAAGAGNASPRAAMGAGNANSRSVTGGAPAGKGLAMAASKAAGRGSAKGQEMRKFAKGGKIDGIAKRGKTKGKIC